LSELETFINDGWQQHADDAAGVALSLPSALDRVRDEAGLISLAQLAHHVYGEHLAAWSDGLKFLAALGRLPAFDGQGTSGQTLLRLRASLALAAGEGDARSTLTASDRIRVGAMAAASLAGHDTARATTLFQEALEEARSADLPASDPMNRSLAVTGNNLASTLEEKAGRSAGERELMILAARTGRHYWERAGTWLETERAEYRLAMTWLQAGDPAQARHHAQCCLEIVSAQAEPPALERFFAWEALGVVERAAGNSTGHAHALTQARSVFDELAEDDRGWCGSSLEKLSAAPTGAVSA
jgi:hypothetical protein